jgi:hypothetical protein
MSMPEDSVLENQLRECVSDTVPPEVEVRLRARLAEFHSRLNARETVDATPGRRARLTMSWKLGLSCAAAGLLIAALGLLLWPRTSLADVAAALFQQSWVHSQTASNFDGESEFWYSPSRNIVAMRRPNWTTYEDYRLQFVDSYEARDKVVYRSPIASWQSGARREYEAMMGTLAALLQAERLPEKPLASLDFLAQRRTTIRVLDQRMEKITEAGHNWLDYRLTVADPSFEQPLRLFFRVDAATKLLALCRSDWQLKGRPATVETRFDYPERGPADLYDLGVPRTVQRVDLVPTGDLKRIMETIRAGRERMDNYRAIFVTHTDGDNMWWIERPLIFYRKDTKLRADYVAGWTGDISATKRPDQREDLGKWWRERTKFFRYYPESVVRGATIFRSELKHNTHPDGTQDAEIVSVAIFERPDSSEIYPVEWTMRPEFACRPPMNLGVADGQPVLELHPIDGPPGCIRLSIRRRPQEGRINKKGITAPDGNRYWLDPERDFMAIRWEVIVRDAAGQEKVIRRVTAEETARSPQGVWYASKIRHSFPDPVGSEKFRDEIYELYIDFDVNLPDSLFEPPMPGKKR